MYGLVHNNRIQVGPRTWSYNFFNDYLVENNLDNSELSRNDPAGPIITSEWKILPVTSLLQPTYDNKFEQLAGPYWSINESDITGYYDIADLSVDSSKSILKSIVTDNRYKVETGKLIFTFSDGQEVQLFTSREDRSTYLDAYLIMADNAKITFKFVNSVFRAVTKTELGQIVATGSNHIKTCFEWEAQKHAEIDACVNLNELKPIELRHPSQIVE